MGKMVKVARFRLICHQIDENGNEMDYREIYKLLWKLQQQTREIKNKAIQLCWDFQNRSDAHYRQYGTPLNAKAELGLGLQGYLYKQLKEGNNLYSGNTSTTVAKAYQEFNAAKKEIFSGNRSILSYKKNQPLELHNKTITLSASGRSYLVNIKLFNKSCFQTINYYSTSINFVIEACDKAQRTILDRCIAGQYKVTASKLLYDEKSRRWVLNLGYEFEVKDNDLLERNRILGVDLGIHYPICASVYGELSRFVIEGGEIEEFRKRVEIRKRSLQRQGKYCGEGRIGHGRKTRCKPIDSIEDKIARFRDTCNHKYSKALIDYAVKHKCGTIQMEDLTGITDRGERFLKNWSYFDLQTKIKYKASEAGIQVIVVSPEYTSQRCSKCGCIDRENRPSQSVFVCRSCGFEANADYNASQNIALAGINKIIRRQMRCESEENG